MTKLGKKKPYEGHEIVYQRMKKKGILIWGQKGSGSTDKSCHPETNNFLKDVLSQPWAPKSGKVIELGCGTGPILRSICKKGFGGLGVDVSKTAIAMAKKQSKGLDIRFRRVDVCNLNVNSLGKFDLAIDGHCLHCIIQPEDRKVFLENTFKMLKKGGLFIVLTMCSPVDGKAFSQVCKGQKLIDHTIYVPYDKATEFEGFRTIKGQDYLPTRKVLHWKSILSEIRQAGFHIMLLRYNHPASKDPFGSLSVGALT